MLILEVFLFHIFFLPECLPPLHIFYSNILPVLMFAVILYLHRVYEQNNISDKLFQTLYILLNR